MLSIIIPCYQYPTFDLIEELHSQCSSLAIPFEIIVKDDCSKNQFNNFKINQLTNCSYLISPENKGRSITRNDLIKQTKYPWILMLDCDMMPSTKEFISNYINEIANDKDVIFGGIEYQKNLSNKNEMLRWIYGTEREAKSASERNQSLYKNFLCSNTLFSRKVFDSILFDEEISTYGYEDLLLSKEVINSGFNVLHIDNTAWHLKLDDNLVFLDKVEKSTQTLAKLILNKKMDWQDTKLSAYYEKNNNNLSFKVLKFAFKSLNLKFFLKQHLLSTKPRLKYLDLYRLLIFDQNYHQLKNQ